MERGVFSLLALDYDTIFLLYKGMYGTFRMYDHFFVRVFLICTTMTEKSVTDQASEFVQWASA
jgi:hypothetical protein